MSKPKILTDIETNKNDISSLIARIGNNEELNTEEKTKIILALNEVNNKANEVNTKATNTQQTLTAHLDDYGQLKDDFEDHELQVASADNVHGLRSSRISLGSNSFADGSNSIAIGTSTQATHASTIAIGNQSTSVGDSSISIGPISESSGIASMTIGFGAVSNESNSISIGRDITNDGSHTVALGRQAVVDNNNEGMLGATGSTRTNHWIVPGAFTVNGTKNFEMPHPHPDKRYTHRLRHGAVESPTAGDTLYRFTIEATADNETVELQLPDYFEYLNKDVDVWVNGDGHFGRAFGKVEDNTLKVTCELAGAYKCLVIGTRNDDHQSIQDWSIKGVEREIGESWTGETYAFSVDEIVEVEEITEVA